jgi:hypothetical protein
MTASLNTTEPSAQQASEQVLSLAVSGSAFREVVTCVALSAATCFCTNAFRLCRSINPDAFRQSWLISGAITSPWTWFLLATAGLTAVMLWKTRWQDHDEWTAIRWLIIPPIAIFAWCYSVYEYNFFLDRAHMPDRGLLFILGAASIWRPAFLGFFLTQLGLILAHLGYPLPFSWTDKSALIDVLVLTNLFLVGHRFRWCDTRHFLVAAIYVLAIHYFRPAVGKLALGWLTHSDLENLFLSTVHQNGWFTPAGSDAIDSIAKSLSVLGWWLMLATLLIELLPLLWLTRRWVLAAGLLACVGMHLGILFSSGIFFWKWIALDLGMLVAVYSISEDTRKQLFGGVPSVALAGLLCAGWLVYISAPNLAWYDSAMAVRYRVYITGESGQVYDVPPRLLAPFDLQFAQSRLSFVSQEPQLVDCFGSTFTLASFQAASTAVEDQESLSRQRRLHGTVKFDPARRDSLRDLLVAFVRLPPEQRPLGIFAALPDPPQHISTFGLEASGQDVPVWNWQEPATLIQIRRATAIHRNHRSLPIADEVADEVQL